ncbi:MAG: LrgB family protein [Phascolarctobacterium sp.]|nr:LrgB family protein [Phascolarctobacterium sp.]
MLPELLLNSPLFGMGLTIIVYCACEFLVHRLKLSIVPPIVFACPAIILFLLYAPNVNYQQYKIGGDFINFLLGPATIALALPLYRNRHVIQANAFSITIGILVATLSAIFSVYLLGKSLGASEAVLLSLLPKSVTNPIALEITKTIGGIQPLTAAVVISTGMLGATINHKLLKILGVKNDLAAGIAIGASSHGIGTSVCAHVSAVQLATGGVSIALTGIATSILIPLLLPILKTL